MSYQELIAKVLNGKSVNATAKALGESQKTFERYVKAVNMPPCTTAVKMARAANMPIEEVVLTIAEEAAKKTRKTMEKISTNFEALLSHVRPHGLRLSMR